VRPRTSGWENDVRRWRTTLYVAWIAQAVSTMGFTFVLPFLPLYLRELGIADGESVVMWAGLLVAATPVTMAIFSPIWGALADRYGRKIMVERAMFGGAVLLALMGLVQNVHQLLALRLLQGAVTGTVTALVALVSTTSPPQKSGYSQGMMRMAFFCGVAVGPIVGGAVSDSFGYRFSFLVAGVLIFAGGLLVLRRSEGAVFSSGPECASGR